MSYELEYRDWYKKNNKERSDMANALVAIYDGTASRKTLREWGWITPGGGNIVKSKTPNFLVSAASQIARGLWSFSPRELAEGRFQNTQQLLAYIHGITLLKVVRTQQEDDEIEEEISAVNSRFDRARNTTSAESLITPGQSFILAKAQQQGNLCATCQRLFGTRIARLSGGYSEVLCPWFEHWTPDAAFHSIVEKNQNTKDPRNCVTCQVCNRAKSNLIRREAILTPLSLEDARDVAASAWKRWKVLDPEEAFQRDTELLALEHGRI